MPAIRRLLVEDAADAGLLVAVSDVHGRLLWVEGSADPRRRAEAMHFVEGALWSEAELRLAHQRQAAGVISVSGVGAAGVPGPRNAPAGLRVLGLSHAELRLPGRTPQLVRPRHGELLLVLGEHPDGMTGAQLELALHDDTMPGVAGVTVRAELSRLRSTLASLGGPTISAKPYRISPLPQTDVAQVRAALRRGDVRTALAACAGPVLPLSSAPAVVALRERLEIDLRQAVLRSADPDLLWEYAVRPEQVYDLDLWQACLQIIPRGTARHTAAARKVAQLDAELGA